jgi:hypothetical protein
MKEVMKVMMMMTMMMTMMTMTEESFTPASGSE